MPYTPDATDTAQPADAGVKASTAAAEFRTLKAYIKNTLLAGAATWTGTPSFQTQAAADNSLKAATTAFVQQEITRLTGLVVNSGGNVGIGTTSPGTKLEVSGASNAAEIRLRSTDATNATLRAYVNGAEAGKLAFLSGGHAIVETAGIERLRVTPVGYMGIGTTTPQSNFVVSNAGGAGLEIAAAGGYGSGPALTAYNRSGTAYVPLTSYALANTWWVGGLGRAMDLDTSGNLGIGVSTPTQRLDVRGQGMFGTDNFTGRINFGTSSQWYLSAAGTSTANATFSLNGWNGTSYSQMVTVDSTGGVGVGATAPHASAALDVQSTTKGLRLPNMTTTQKNAIASPAAGLMVFDTTLAKACLYTGAAWQTITSS